MSATGSSAGVWKVVTTGVMVAPVYSSSPYPKSSVWRSVRNCV